MTTENTSGSPTTAETVQTAAPAAESTVQKDTKPTHPQQASTRALLDTIDLGDKSDDDDDGDEGTDEPTKDGGKKPEAKTEAEKSADDSPKFENLEANDLLKRINPEILKDPSVVKALTDLDKGVAKVVKQNQSERQALGNWNKLIDALSDPETRDDAYKFLGKELGLAAKQETVKTEPENKKGDAPEIGDDNFDWKEDFESEADYKAFQKVFNRALDRKMKDFESRFESKVAPLEKAHKEAEQNAKAQANERNYQAWLDKNAPDVIKQIAGEDGGWSPTKEMIDQAVRALPEIAKESVAKAVRMYHSDERLKHHQTSAESKRPKAPELPNKKGNDSTTQIDPSMSTRELLDRMPING